jgi:hypothetical protein
VAVYFNAGCNESKTKQKKMRGAYPYTRVYDPMRMHLF